MLVKSRQIFLPIYVFFSFLIEIAQNRVCLQTINKNVQKYSESLWNYCTTTDFHKKNKQSALTIKNALNCLIVFVAILACLYLTTFWFKYTAKLNIHILGVLFTNKHGIFLILKTRCILQMYLKLFEPFFEYRY